MQLVNTTPRRPRITTRRPIYSTSMFVPDTQPIFGVMNWLTYMCRWGKNRPNTWRVVIFRYAAEMLTIPLPANTLEVCKLIQKDFDRFKNWVQITYK